MALYTEVQVKREVKHYLMQNNLAKERIALKNTFKIMYNRCRKIWTVLEIPLKEEYKKLGETTS